MGKGVLGVVAVLAVVALMVPAVLAGQRVIRAVPTRRVQPTTEEPQLRNLPPGVTEAQVRSHVMAPANTQGCQMEEVGLLPEVKMPMRRVATRLTTLPLLDVDAFRTDVHNALKDSTVGYIMQVRKDGALINSLIWNWAQTPLDAGKGWTEDTRMNVGSVSKFLTAVGLVKLLDSKGISYDTKIIDYLPTYWTKGPNIDQITFRHLMTQRSGFNTGKSASDYPFMKARVAEGVPGVGSYDYENMNFGLCRILMPIINGEIDKGANFGSIPGLNDAAWDYVATGLYKDYMQANVFTPAGVSNVGFGPLVGQPNALAYPFPPLNAGGWNSGDKASIAGGAGCHLSCKELLDVIDHVRRRGTIISPQKAQYMLDNHFGIDQTIETAAGKIYNKNGLWARNGKTEQCVAYFFPANIEVVAFVNSPIGLDGKSLRGIVKDAYVAALTN